ncbi:MAG TPA: tetratricopeptide repeat protein [Leptospiraceae bacterium]|nr:tetratricopeptide repeat protein [Leptospiraceae bacterium]HNM01831.1 tetratricopeptide repeat protein [Leptospiraceae bacterium]
MIFAVLVLSLHCKKAVNDLMKDSKVLESECESGKFRSCTQVGIRMAFGTYGYRKDYSKAKTFLEKACSGEDGLGCKELAILHEYGRGTEKSLSKAAEYYKISCEKEEAFGCFYLGKFYKKGMGVSKDPKEAEKYLRKACDLKLDMACKEL